MLRSNALFPKAVQRWAGQVAASVSATLVAASLYAALPRVFVPGSAPLATLTSGGKFAARIPGADERLAGTGSAAIETLPPPPSLAAGSARPPLVAVMMTVGADTFAGASRVEVPRVLRLPRRAVARHEAVAVATTAPIQALAATLPAKAALAGPARDEDGLLTKAFAMTRSAWAATADLGHAVASRVMP